MKKWEFLIVALISLFMVAAGCTSESDQPQVFEQISKGVTAQLTIPHDPIPVMADVPLTLKLSDTSGQPINGATVQYDLTMPDMTMPPNKPDAIEQEGGVYEVSAIFTMAGKWNCHVVVTLSDVTSLEFDFIFEAK